LGDWVLTQQLPCRLLGWQGQRAQSLLLLLLVGQEGTGAQASALLVLLLGLLLQVRKPL
jgi:hypothetical protein